MSVDKQPQLIDSLPEGQLRNTATAIQRQQADAFGRDPFEAGTTLYGHAGPPVPIDDIQGRLRQARQVVEMRSGDPTSPFEARRTPIAGPDATRLQLAAEAPDRGTIDQTLKRPNRYRSFRPATERTSPRKAHSQIQRPIPGLSGKEKADDIPRTDGYHRGKLFGIYSSRECAQAAIDRLRRKPGFKDYPDRWRIHARTLDRDSWAKGFVPETNQRILWTAATRHTDG